MMRRILSVAGVAGLGIVMLTLGATRLSHAQISPFPTSDRPAGYVVFPKVVVDSIGLFNQGHLQDTLIQLTNTGQDTRVVECFYVDATSRCNNALSGDTGQFRYCRTSADCRPGGLCLSQWSETDFTITLTPDQPVGWRASQTTDLAVADPSASGVVKPVGPYFIGELKCLEVDGTTNTLPIQANDLKGEASIYDVDSFNIAPASSASVDVREYNAVGFQAQTAPNADQFLCLGASPGSAHCVTAEYASCPSILVLDHFFDGAEDPDFGGVVTTDLTLVPCSEDLRGTGADIAKQTATMAQLLIFNEFEQRISATVSVDCFRETPLSQIDMTAGNQNSSAFSAAVQGTLTGQTRIHPILSSDPNTGNGLLAVAEEFHCDVPDPITGSCAGERYSKHHSGAFNVNYIGTNGTKGDIVSYSVSTQ